MRKNNPLTCGAALLILGLLTPCALAAKLPEGKPLQDGVSLSDTIAPDEHGRPKLAVFHYTVEDHCISQLTLHLTKDPKKGWPHLWMEIRDFKDERKYRYHIGYDMPDYIFYPVLNRGDYAITLDAHDVGVPFTLELKRIKAEVTEQDRAAAQAAVDKGIANLLTQTPAKANDGDYAVAIESLVIAALSSDPDGKYTQTIDADYLPWLKARFKDQPASVTWDGRPVSGLTGISQPLYTHAIATLALAEAARRSPAARELAARAADFLLAAQLTDHRPPPWNPVDPKNHDFGGWRYKPDSKDADISVSGWCIVALTACAVSDIQPAGMRESLRSALGFVRRCGDKSGFGYGPGGDGNPVRDGIGGLVYRLNGETGLAYDVACNQVDRHLFDGTQVEGRTDDYALYYAYYATRLNYLRGSSPWEAWRMSAIRQLVRLQNPDGSWQAYNDDPDPKSHRYATALSVMILRMCLNEVPDYLKQEVKGF